MLTRKTSLVVAVGTFVIILLLYTSRIGAWTGLDDHYYRHDPHRSQHAPQGTRPGEDVLPRPLATSPECDGFPDTSKVLLVMKTGASEAYSRVPTQLMTLLRCLPDFLIFSDMDQTIAGQPIYDSLTDVLPEAQEGNSDFDLYRRQQWCLVDQESCNKLGDPASEGWNLDKYKNIHITEKTYAMRPGYDWYLFVDADTYVVWPNLMRWIKDGKLDPRKKLYLGSVAMLGSFGFGHGGSGYLVSRGAMEDFAGKHPGVANEYDVRTKGVCCGDYHFGLALKNKTDVGVQQMWPTINGEKPSTLPFGPSHWCHPIVTMHHLNAEEINTFWDFEQRRSAALTSASLPPQPLLLKDIYNEFLAPYLIPVREDWDNLANNRYYLDPAKQWPESKTKRTKPAEQCSELELRAHKSAEDCEAACKSLEGTECFRWRFQGGACSISNAFAMGKPVKRGKGDDGLVVSGWDVEKIRAWVEEQGECGKVRWPRVNQDK